MGDDNAETGVETQSDADAVAAMAAEGSKTEGQDNGDNNSEDRARPDHVPEKFWDAEKGEVRADEAIKSYTELEKRFGSFTGSPDEYKVNISDELKEKGVEIDADNGLLSDLKGMSKELGLNQDGFDKAINMLGMNFLADKTADEEFRLEQLAALGDGADRRIDNLRQWASRNLNQEHFDGFSELTQSATSVQALERIVAMTRSAPSQPNNSQAAPAMDASKLREMKFAKDENGRMKYDTDPEYRKQVQAGYKALYGEEPAQQMTR